MFKCSYGNKRLYLFVYGTVISALFLSPLSLSRDDWTVYLCVCIYFFNIINFVCAANDTREGRRENSGGGEGGKKITNSIHYIIRGERDQ